MNDGVWNVSSTLRVKMYEMIKFLVDFFFLWILRYRGNFFYQIWSGVTSHIIPHINWCVLLISSIYLITKAPFAQPVGLCHVSLTLLCSTDPQTQSRWCVLITSVMAVVVISFPALLAAQFLNILLVRDSSTTLIMLSGTLHSGSMHACFPPANMLSQAFGYARLQPLGVWKSSPLTLSHPGK